MARLDDQLARLAALSPAELRREWERVHRSAAPAIAAKLLRIGIAYRLQEKASGVSTKAVARKLTRQVSTISRDGQTVAAPASIRTGTRLVRSWQGRSLSVLVVDDGYLFEDRTYPSLTAIACEVTKSNRSGPRFFGLTGNA